MNLPQYNSITADFREYEFFSIGPKGRIKKLVSFTKVRNDPIMYNLAFGDADPVTGLINDKITTNNDDRDIVLATVANTINSFCDHNGNHYILPQVVALRGQDYIKWALTDYSERSGKILIYMVLSKANLRRLNLVITTMPFW